MKTTYSMLIADTDDPVERTEREFGEGRGGIRPLPNSITFFFFNFDLSSSLLADLSTCSRSKALMCILLSAAAAAARIRGEIAGTTPPFSPRGSGAVARWAETISRAIASTRGCGHERLLSSTSAVDVARPFSLPSPSLAPPAAPPPARCCCRLSSPLVPPDGA